MCGICGSEVSINVVEILAALCVPHVNEIDLTDGFSILSC